jgi:hypothetical protein
MKGHLRFFLILLISLALPLSGMAGSVAAEPCPMQAAGMEMPGAMQPDCCEDMAGPAEHGKPCKSGQECQSSSLLQVSAVNPPISLSGPVVLAFASDFLPSRAPSGVWRPPRV